jgi:hypothetical protein
MSWKDVADAIDRMTNEPPDSDLYLRPAVKILAEKFVGEMSASLSRACKPTRASTSSLSGARSSA